MEGTDVNSKTGLDLEVTNPYNHNEKDYSSLTDMNNLPLFSEQFEAVKKQKNNVDKKKIKDLSQKVFCVKMHESNDDVRVNQLFLSENQLYSKQEESNTSIKTSYFIPISGICIIVFLYSMIVYCQKRRRKLKEKLYKMGQEKWNEK
ncbi:MAG: type VII secretion protein EssA [Lachnobacterium sp.]|nr:type VII secretion protein EssA [Lachnobacterium sp.]